MEKQPLPSTTVEMPSSRTRRSRHSAWAMAPAAAACWYSGSLCSWLQLPSGRCTQVGTVMCVCSCGSTVTDAGGRIGHRAGGAMHELGHDQLGAHRLGGLGVRVVLARPAGVGLEILGGGLDSLAVDAQDGGPACARHRARRGCSRPWVLTRSRRRRRPSASASVCRGPHPCADVCRRAPRRSRCRSPRRADPTLPHRVRSIVLATRRGRCSTRAAAAQPPRADTAPPARRW